LSYGLLGALQLTSDQTQIEARLAGLASALSRPGPRPELRWLFKAVFLVVAVLLTATSTLAFPQRVDSVVTSSQTGLDIPDAPLTQVSGQGQHLSQTQAPAQSSAQPVSPAIPAPGSIQGVVVNRDGAVYQGVHVDLASNASTPVATTTTDSDGWFHFTAVSPGPFRISVSSEGFTTQVISGVLHPSESYEVKAVVLPLASTSSQVMVTASPEEVAEAQLKDEEHQRIFGILPNFYIVYAPSAPPLNPRQKFHLAWRSSIDPFAFLLTGAIAGVEQANDGFKGYGQGAQGYAKRYGANFADNSIGNMIGGALLPSLLKQDPRYFVKGSGTIRSRILYAIKSSVMCKGDNGRWQPNYSGVLGGLATGGISNLYYPASNRNGAAVTFENSLIGLGGGAIQNIFQEFVIRKLTPNVANYSPTKP